MKVKDAPCATKVLGGDCEELVSTHFSHPEEQTWVFCDDCLDDIEDREGDGLYVAM